jgi:beta-galactosidase
MNNSTKASSPVSRRQFVQQCAWSAVALAATPILGCRTAGSARTAPRNGPATRTLPLEQDWLFGGKLDPAGLAPTFNDAAFARVTLPHSVAKLSWQNWQTSAWQDQWLYRRHFTMPTETKGLRTFLHFDGVMVGATPTLNGHPLPQHLGGYLPFHYEITDYLTGSDNVLAVAVDSRWSNVPPQGAAVGAKSIDYLEPGGIYRSVRLESVPSIFISDVFAKPVKVLDADRRIEVACSLDAAAPVPTPVQIEVELRQGARVVARAQTTLRIDQPGSHQAALTLSKLGNVALWDVQSPTLYEVVTTLSLAGKPVHDHRLRLGLREARFELEGFFLNGKRLQLFGLNRHELFPYVGGAMPRRVMRRDAELLRREFNCNMVRCSHYPQSEAFLDTCDELGLMVWEEVPGWQYIGDDAWKQLLLRDVKDMVVRDRNHPAIIIWGTRVNESANNEELYKQTRALAKSLDDSRPTSGSMTPDSRKNWKRDWHEEVFAFDDYHAAPEGGVGIDDATPGVPYMLAEAVGQFNYTKGKNFDSKYRRAGDMTLQQQQALRHAQAHSRAAANPRICGMIAWCAFDYASLINPYNGLKCPGVTDSFRIPKLGASFYQAQVSPQVRPVIQPNFYWDFGPQTPRGPGKGAAIFSNCERLELFVNGRSYATLRPDSAGFPHLQYPPFLVDLDLDGAGHPELRIDGYVGTRLVLSRSFSSDPTQDRFVLEADDRELVGDGSDSTRLVFKVVDKFGADRAFAAGEVTFAVTGPGVLVGDNPFSLQASGGVGAVWLKTLPLSPGRITVKATHSSLGSKAVTLQSLKS